MNNENKLNINSVAVQTHITTHQAIISRMATNIVSCKTWCITTVAAIIALGGGKPVFVLSSLIPIILFSIIDSYYLDLERKFRKNYEEFLTFLNNEELNSDEFKKRLFAFSLAPVNSAKSKILNKENLIKLKSLIFSPSIYMFYGLQSLFVIILFVVVLNIKKDDLPKNIQIQCETSNTLTKCEIINQSN